MLIGENMRFRPAIYLIRTVFVHLLFFKRYENDNIQKLKACLSRCERISSSVDEILSEPEQSKGRIPFFDTP